MKLSTAAISGLIVATCVLVVALVIGFSLYGYVNALRTEGITQETQLTAQYLSNQNNLSSYVSGFYEQMGIVQYKSEKLDQILTDYAKGRSFGGNGQPEGQALINAVHEAVPDLKGLDIADRMIDYVQTGRESYKTIQDKFLDMLRAYDRWRADGFVQSYIVKNFLGIPSDRLEARIGTAVTRGTAARDQMFQIVLAPQAAQAYTTGQMAPLQFSQPTTNPGQ